ncbi:MAG: glucose sorbosone dehydrogenase, partial [Candidatus Dadabacteria bacterium]|nr:glucose sorbosone dehydrogenase [Candidatus Dadabacteria bacterium]
NGKNYGWNIMEGSLCHEPRSGCDTSGLEPPIHEYGRDEGGTIIVGPVYRGSIPELFGKLIYGDFVSGTIWTLVYTGTSVTENSEVANAGEFALTTFGRDEDGEVYVCTLDGIIYRLVRE